jgi:hypothetical protein
MHISCALVRKPSDRLRARPVPGNLSRQCRRWSMFTKAREERQQPRADQASRRRGRLPQRRLFPSAVEACPHRPLNAGRSRQPQHATTRLSPRAVERWVKAAASASRHSRASPSSTSRDAQRIGKGGPNALSLNHNTIALCKYPWCEWPAQVRLPRRSRPAVCFSWIKT